MRESGHNPVVEDLPSLDDDCRVVYEHSFSPHHPDTGPPGLDPDRHARAVGTLLSLRLLEPDAGGVPRPIGPDQGAAGLLAAVEADLRAGEERLGRRRIRAAELRRELSWFQEVHAANRLRDGHPEMVRLVGDPEAVRTLLADAVAHATGEVMSCQPGGARPITALAEALPRDLAMLERGIVLRTLYQHTARFHAPTQDYVSKVAGVGSQVRTLEELPGRMIIVDNAVAFLPAPGEGAIVVRESSLLAFLVGVFEQYWNRATPFVSGPAAARAVTGSITAALTRLLADGLKDEVIARRLGMSIRTCRRHIADLMESLGARSRFQAGAIAERVGLTERPEPGVPGVRTVAGASAAPSVVSVD
jgi:Bacterial regulatory proteins, luxR family